MGIFCRKKNVIMVVMGSKNEALSMKIEFLARGNSLSRQPPEFLSSPPKISSNGVLERSWAKKFGEIGVILPFLIFSFRSRFDL
jgi:hypothetical protein